MQSTKVLGIPHLSLKPESYTTYASVVSSSKRQGLSFNIEVKAGEISSAVFS